MFAFMQNSVIITTKFEGSRVWNRRNWWKRRGWKIREVPNASIESIKKVLEETLQKCHYASSKVNSLKILGADVLSSSSKDDLKTKLLKAIVIKKNLKKDVEILFARFKEFEKVHSNPEEVNEFKQACNNVIRVAQKSHAEIKDKVYTIYDKKK